MYSGQIVFSQIMDYLPMNIFRRCVRKYQGNFKVKSFSCLDQFLCMAFAQLTYRESLRDIVTCLRAYQSKLYHMGIRGNVAKSTLADANETRDWRIYADFSNSIINLARRMYANEDLGLEIKQTAYALDSSTIDLCLSVFPWASFRSTKAAVKLHTLLDLRSSIPSFIHISDGKLHDVNVLDQLLPEPGAFYVMDRGYLDFERLYQMSNCLAYFVIKAKSNLRFRRQYSQPVDKATDVKFDQIGVLKGYYTSKKYPAQLRCIKYHDVETQKTLIFLTNNFNLPALTIAELYRRRWQVELFFKWIKQNLRIKRFYGTSENAVKTQIWIAITVYVLVAMIKKRLKIDISLYKILQILSVTIFDKISISQLLKPEDYKIDNIEKHNQLSLLDLIPGH